jgi:ABC-type glycerol-3-phosphate transport system permease component
MVDGCSRLGAIVRTLLPLFFPVLASAPLVVAFIFLQRYVVQGMTAGAIKS